MVIRVKPNQDIPSSEITAESAYRSRRDFLREAGLLGIAMAASPAIARALASSRGAAASQAGQAKAAFGEDLRGELTPWDDVTGYNNYYEFGTDKEDPAENAKNFRTRPWTIGGRYGEKARRLPARGLHQAVQARRSHLPAPLCGSLVDGGSVDGIPDGRLDQTRGTAAVGQVRGVHHAERSEADARPARSVLDWPYVEGLRLDEAMHPLAFLVTGVYGKTLPNQNGAPLRYVAPWKYGFKGCKSIVKIRFTDKQPRTAWNVAAANEYGFYANVNPTVDHPRWTQAKERRIGELSRRPTLMFNGYAEQVASLYSGMDLRKNY